MLKPFRARLSVIKSVNGTCIALLLVGPLITSNPVFADTPSSEHSAKANAATTPGDATDTDSNATNTAQAQLHNLRLLRTKLQQLRENLNQRLSQTQESDQTSAKAARFWQKLARQIGATDPQLSDLHARYDNALAQAQQNEARVVTEELAALEQELRLSLGTKVELRQQKTGRGKIVINFNNPEEFERLHALICPQAAKRVA